MKENKIKIKTPNLEEQNVTGNLTAVFTTSKATTRMTDIFQTRKNEVLTLQVD